MVGTRLCWRHFKMSQRPLTDVIVIRLCVELLVYPVLLHAEDLLAAGIHFPKSSAQNHLQFLNFISKKVKNHHVFEPLRMR